jgi:hypothetical protein
MLLDFNGRWRDADCQDGHHYDNNAVPGDDLFGIYECIICHKALVINFRNYCGDGTRYSMYGTLAEALEMLNVHNVVER